MEVQLYTPSAVEGDWELVDADGNTIASSEKHPGAILAITPIFYKGTFSQTLMRTLTHGKKGAEVRNALRIAAQTGKITSELASELPAKIVPKFDTLPREEHKKEK